MPRVHCTCKFRDDFSFGFLFLQFTLTSPVLSLDLILQDLGLGLATRVLGPKFLLISLGSPPRQDKIAYACPIRLPHQSINQSITQVQLLSIITEKPKKFRKVSPAGSMKRLPGMTGKFAEKISFKAGMK